MKAQTEKRGPGRPATGQMPKRYFRMDDESWKAVENAAEATGQTVSDFIRDALLRATKRRKSTA
jgi:uncharacterized protein (DUF1778 family)